MLLPVISRSLGCGVDMASLVVALYPQLQIDPSLQGPLLRSLGAGLTLFPFSPYAPTVYDCS